MAAANAVEWRRSKRSITSFLSTQLDYEYFKSVLPFAVWNVLNLWHAASVASLLFFYAFGSDPSAILSPYSHSIQSHPIWLHPLAAFFWEVFAFVQVIRA